MRTEGQGFFNPEEPKEGHMVLDSKAERNGGDGGGSGGGRGSIVGW